MSPELLGGEFTTEWLAASLTGRNVPVKELLLERSIAKGLGNLYTDESLFLSVIRAAHMVLPGLPAVTPSVISVPAVFVPVYRRATKWFRRRGRGLR